MKLPAQKKVKGKGKAMYIPCIAKLKANITNFNRIITIYVWMFQVNVITTNILAIFGNVLFTTFSLVSSSPFPPPHGIERLC